MFCIIRHTLSERADWRALQRIREGWEPGWFGWLWLWGCGACGLVRTGNPCLLSSTVSDSPDTL